MHNSSNAGGAAIVANVAEGAMAAFTFPNWNHLEIGHELSTQLIQVQAKLHLESCIAAFRVLALARCLWTLLCVCTCWAAILLADGGLTVAARMFTFLRGGHKRPS
jgi:hypothetical protein